MMKHVFRAIILFAAIITVSSCLNLRKPSAVVREPATPAESRITYTVPPAPRVSLSVGEALLSWRGLIGKVDKITEGVYLARGFAIANVSMVVTDDGVVIIDSTESPDSAAEILAKFLKITDKPIKYLIYTHGHGDHTQGSKVFYKPGVNVIATREFLDFVKFETGLTGPYLRMARTTQSGKAAPDYIRVKIPFAKAVRGEVGSPDIVMPTITFDDHYEFELGGQKFRALCRARRDPGRALHLDAAEARAFLRGQLLRILPQPVFPHARAQAGAGMVPVPGKNDRTQARVPGPGTQRRSHRREGSDGDFAELPRRHQVCF